jgi:L-iditol 2-dehydrogenase
MIQGAGCIGLATLLSAKAAGASKIFISDIEEKKLQYAKKLGATEALNAKKVDIVKKIMESTGEGTDIVIDCVGNEKTIAQTSSIVNKGGSIALVGMTLKEEIKYNLMQLLSKEASIQTVFRYRNLYPIALDLLSSGRIYIKDMVTNTFSFDKTKEAFDYVIENSSEVVKGVIEIN